MLYTLTYVAVHKKHFHCLHVTFSRCLNKIIYTFGFLWSTNGNVRVSAMCMCMYVHSYCAQYKHQQQQ